MIQVTGQYGLVSGNMDDLEDMCDHIMKTLLLSPEILDPTVAVALDRKLLQVEMLVDTNDVIEATRKGIGELRMAFELARVVFPNSHQLFIHQDLLKTETEVLAPIATPA